MSPAHAKRIWRALGENINRYAEAQFGAIREVCRNPLLSPTWASCSRRAGLNIVGGRITVSAHRERHAVPPREIS